MEFTDINKNLPLGNNTGGIQQFIYFGLHSDVKTWPTN
jgi:hypothetical protein